MKKVNENAKRALRNDECDESRWAESQRRAALNAERTSLVMLTRGGSLEAVMGVPNPPGGGSMAGT